MHWVLIILVCGARGDVAITQVSPMTRVACEKEAAKSTSQLKMWCIDAQAN